MTYTQRNTHVYIDIARGRGKERLWGRPVVPPLPGMHYVNQNSRLLGLFTLHRTLDNASLHPPFSGFETSLIIPIIFNYWIGNSEYFQIILTFFRESNFLKVFTAANQGDKFSRFHSKDKSLQINRIPITECLTKFSAREVFHLAENSCLSPFLSIIP